MTVLTDTQVITASGGLVELGYAQTTAATTIGTSSTSLIPTSGNLTVVCDGSPVLVEVSIPYVTAPASNNTRIQIVVDGVTNNLGIFSPNGFVPGQFKYRLTPSAGSHTFSVVGYGDVAGTMGAGLANGGGAYVPAFLRVSKIVQATQWPAVTTGTIICTSSTRPASPFAGQRIYETDTSLSYTYSGSAWVQTENLGAWTTFSPTLTQSGTVTKTDSYCKWTRNGRTIHATTYVTATASGTTANPATLSLPVTAVAPAPTRIGSCHYYDASTGVRYTGMAELRSGGNAIGFVGDWSAGDAWGAIPNLPVQTSDQIGY